MNWRLDVKLIVEILIVLLLLKVMDVWPITVILDIGISSTVAGKTYFRFDMNVKCQWKYWCVWFCLNWHWFWKPLESVRAPALFGLLEHERIRVYNT